ncbi:MAG: 2-amino-4-hydroxy-6-hydroxymethyldihydropteridine diphosphokinase, partial [Bdellovibrionales bacterium]
VPVSDAPWYANAVSLIETDKTPSDLLGVLNKIEADFGRVRSYRNAPRILDLDILAFNDEIIGEDGAHLCVPHPRMHNRAFVLKPLNEVAPEWQHPALKKSIAQLIRDEEKVQPEVFRQTVPLNPGDEYRVAG